MHEVLDQLVSILRGMWKYRWVGMVLAWPILLVGMGVVYMLPNKYDASARIQVDTQTMLKPLLGGMTILPNPEQQVALMTRTLLSRPNVEKLMRLTDLDLRAKAPQERDAMIDMLQRELRLAGRGGDLYTISFRHETPAVAQRVVQSLLNMFVEESLGDNKKDAERARRFLDQQIKTYEQKLIESESRIKEFKLKHLGSLPGLPGSGGDYFVRLQDLASRIEPARQALREAEMTRDEIKKQLEGSQAGPESNVGSAPAAAPLPAIELPTRASPLTESRIEAVRKQLDELMLRYTNQHPDVRAAQRLLAQLEAQRSEELTELRRRAEEARAKTAASPRGPETGPATTAASIVQQQLRIALAEAESDVAVKRSRLRAVETDHADLRGKAKSLSQIEHEFAQLNRDYEIHRRNYQQFLSGRDRVDLSQEVDSSAQLVDFKVIEPPRVSPTPVWPDRTRFALMVFGGALAAGLAVTLLLSQVRPAFYHTKSLRELVNRPLLGSVSMVWNSRQKRRARLGRVAFALSCLAFFGVFGGGLAYFVMHGVGA